MEIILKDLSGNNLNPDQLNKEDFYYKIYALTDGTVKRKELIRDDKIFYILFYVGMEETHATVLASSVMYDCEVILVETNSYGPFTIELSRTYVKGVLTKWYNSLLLGQEFLGVEKIDLDTYQPVYEESHKTINYRDKDGDIYEYYQFFYNKDGTLKYFESMTFEPDFDYETYKPEKLREIFIMPEWKFDFYLFAKLLPDLDLYNLEKGKNHG